MRVTAREEVTEVQLSATLRASPESRRATGLSEAELRRVIAYIEDGLESDLSVSSVARILTMGPTRFKALFRQSVGMPLHQYIIRRRVDAAASMLRDGSLSIAAVAVRTGFCDQSHLARCMKRLIGSTPRRFVLQTLGASCERAAS